MDEPSGGFLAQQKWAPCRRGLVGVIRNKKELPQNTCGGTSDRNGRVQGIRLLLFFVLLLFLFSFVVRTVYE